MIKTLLIFLAGTIFQQFISDNLPSLKLRDLKKYFDEIFVTLILIALCLYATFNKESQKTVAVIVGIIFIAIVVKAINDKKEKLIKANE